MIFGTTVIDPISQFKLKKIIDINCGLFDISLTNSSIMMILCAFVFIIGTYFSCKKPSEKPTKGQAIIEIAWKFINKIISEQIGEHSSKYFNFIFCLFFYILIGNFLGMIPFGFTFTAQIVVTAFLAVSAFCISIFVGLITHGVKFFSIFIPPKTPIYIWPILIPIEIISFMSRPFSLAIRLFANMVAGHAMIKVFAGFVVMSNEMFTGLLIFAGALASVLPFTINIILVGFELVVAFLQSYIFTILTCIYIKDAIHLHGH